MAGSTENSNPSLFQGTRIGGAKAVNAMGHNHRRALSTINQNIMEASNHPCFINKKEISGKDGRFEKKPPLGHRPVTRALAAQKFSPQKQAPDEVLSTRTSDKERHIENRQLTLEQVSLGDWEVVEVEECAGSGNDAVPMFVKHTEAMMDEIDRMEVEMEDVEDLMMEIDIDSSSLKDPLAVVEYLDDIYDHYRKTESSCCISPDYMDKQFDINDRMRAILIDWLIEVHYKFELMEETLFLTVNLIDRFLERCMVIRKKLQLVGVTAMLIACKYEEVSVPIVDDFVLISDKAYTRQEVLDMEKVMLNALQFNMSASTPYVFMRRFLKAAKSDRKLDLLSHYIIELCLVHYKMLKFRPSLLAAAAIYTAQCSLNQFKQWTKASEWHTNYSEDQLLECSRLMVQFHKEAGAGKLRGVYRKYSTSKFGYAAKAEPALFLLSP